MKILYRGLLMPIQLLALAQWALEKGSVDVDDYFEDHRFLVRRCVVNE